MLATAVRETALLTPDNCGVVIIDLQPHFSFCVTSVDRQLLMNNALLLAKAARIFDIPVIVSTTESRSFGGHLYPQLQAVLPCAKPIERSRINPWDESAFLDEVRRTNRNKLVIAGLWTSTSIAFLTIRALHAGYEIYVVEDCCGDVSALAHSNGMTRMLMSGARPVSALAIMLEWQRDWADRCTFDAVMNVAKSHCVAYGLGIEYAYTMVHGATPSQYPLFVVPGPADVVS